MGSKKDKLIARFLTQPSDFHYKEMIRLLGYFGFEQVKKGRTSGSRVKFMNADGVPIILHRPHPLGDHEVLSIKTDKRYIGIMKYLEYKGYSGSIEYSREDNLLYGKVLGINGLISYEGKTGKELELDFNEAIEHYLADCKNEGIVPEKPFKGSFNVRVSPDLHQKAALLAMESKMSLNNFIAESIKERIYRVTGRRV